MKMNMHIYSLISFALGTAFGFSLAYKIAEKKYEKIANEEIESVKLAFQRQDAKFPLDKDVKPEDNQGEYISKEQKLAEKARNKPDIEIVYHNAMKHRPKDSLANESNIHVIPPNEFGEDESYSQYNFTIFADGTLMDDSDKDVINDYMDELIGEDNLEEIGGYEEGALHIKNEDRRCYIEILQDNRTYSEYLSNNYK